MTATAKTEWLRTSRTRPCKVCRKTDWCTVAADGSVACCMRVPSGKPMGNGGFLHVLSPDLFGKPIVPAVSAPPASLSPDRVGSTWARWATETGNYMVAGLATRLGVNEAACRAIGAAWAWPYDAWAFPMFDGAGEFRGIRLRSDSGEKWALTGSRQGIFLPDSKPDGEEACVCEGPTDLAALLSLGLWGIGRPSCTGGGPEIAEYCRRHGIKRLSVLADNDGPGRAGAERMAAEIRMRARIATLPAKDVREAVKNGASRDTIVACINNATWSW